MEYTHITDKLLDYSTYGSYHYFKGNAILLNKFFVITIYYIILIFDISSVAQLKRYEVLLYGENNLLKSEAYIKKRNNNNDNEFILNLGGNIILVELNNEYKLKIINQIYSKNIGYLKKLNNKSNKFYDDEEEEDLYYDSNDSKNKNETFSVSIF